MSGHCPKCGIFRERLTKDHIVPQWKHKRGVVQGNPDDPSNIQWLCANCHADKTLLDRRESNAFPAIREAILAGNRRPEARARKSTSIKAARARPDVQAKHRAFFARPERRIRYFLNSKRGQKILARFNIDPAQVQQWIAEHEAQS